jgi:FAD binding domain/Berberine and berberine like
MQKRKQQMAVPVSAYGAAALTPRDAAQLARDVGGPVLVPGDDSYAQECATYNLAFARRPAVAVGATSSYDVISAVRFAARRDLPAGVLATGHGTSQPGNGAVLVTTRRMSGVTIDPGARVARVEAGARWQQVIDAAAPHGLAALNGSSPLVGVVGYTTGGGLSPILGRSRGWAADHVRAIEIVTADGRLVRATADRDGELFWAVRGGKDNFGIVTALEFDLFEVPRLYGGGLYFAGEFAADVLHAYRSWAATLPARMTASVALLRLPPLDSVPEPLRGKLAVHVRIAYLGTAAAGARLVAPIRETGPAIIDTVAEMAYQQVGSIHGDPPVPLPVYGGSARLTDLPEAAVDVILESAGRYADCPLAMVEVRQLGGALGHAPEVANAVGGRDAAFQVFCGGVGGPMEAPFIYASMDEVFRGLRPWTIPDGSLNFLSAREIEPHSVAAAFGKDVHDRLTMVKRAYDPGNLFRVNHNIPPAR